MWVVTRGDSPPYFAHSDPSFCRKTTLTKHFRRQHGGRPRSADGEDSDEEGMEGYEASSQSPRAIRHSSTSTVPSQDLNIHFRRNQHPHQIPPQHHISLNNMRHHGHHPQAVYLSPNPSSAGPQAPPIYYSAPPAAYPHTPNSMVHREVDEDYDSASGTDMTGEPNPYHRMQMAQPKYPPQQYHTQHAAAQFSHPNPDAVAYYSPNLPTPAVSPASSCSGPNNLPPPGSQYAQGMHSPPQTGPQHHPTPYQAAPPPNPQHPQAVHYAAAYSGHRIYAISNADDVPRLQNYTTSQNGMPMGPEGTHGLGIAMGSATPLKVEVSTPMPTAAW